MRISRTHRSNGHRDSTAAGMAASLLRMGRLSLVQADGWRRVSRTAAAAAFSTKSGGSKKISKKVNSDKKQAKTYFDIEKLVQHKPYEFSKKDVAAAAQEAAAPPTAPAPAAEAPPTAPAPAAEAPPTAPAPAAEAPPTAPAPAAEAPPTATAPTSATPVIEAAVVLEAVPQPAPPKETPPGPPGGVLEVVVEAPPTAGGGSLVEAVAAAEASVAPPLHAEPAADPAPVQAEPLEAAPQHDGSRGEALEPAGSAPVEEAPGPVEVAVKTSAQEVLPEPAAEAPEPSAVVPEPASEVPEPSAVVPEPAPEVPEPAPEVPEPSAVVPEPAPEVPEPSAVVPEPAPAAPVVVKAVDDVSIPEQRSEELLDSAPVVEQEPGTPVEPPEAQMDPIQKLFLDSIRQYSAESRAAGGLLDAGSDYEKVLAEETAKLQRLYGGGDLTSFPEFKFTEPRLDELSQK